MAEEDPYFHFRSPFTVWATKKKRLVRKFAIHNYCSSLRINAHLVV